MSENGSKGNKIHEMEKKQIKYLKNEWKYNTIEVWRRGEEIRKIS